MRLQARAWSQRVGIKDKKQTRVAWSGDIGGEALTFDFVALDFIRFMFGYGHSKNTNR